MKHVMKYVGLSTLILGGILFLSQFQSCKHDPQGLDQFDEICFNTQVAPILVSQCSECHGGSRGEGGHVIDSVYDNIKDMVKAGDPAGSELYKIVSQPNNPNMMPPNHALSKNQLAILEIWIAQGAKNINCNSNNTPTKAIESTDGALLYATYCVGCHGALATSSKIGVTVSQIQTGISSVPDMKSLSILNSTQQQAIATALSGTPNANPDGSALYATTCAKCHGPLATSQVGGASASKISDAIKSKSKMKYLSSLTSVQISAIANALKNIQGSGD